MKAINHASTNTQDMTFVIIELSVYLLYGLFSVLAGVSTLTIIYGFIGSLSAAFALKILAAASGSASGAKLSRSVKDPYFWSSACIGFVFSLAFSPSIYDYLSPSQPWLDIHTVYFFLGSVGFVSLKIVQRFLGGVEKKADDAGDAVSDTIISRIKRPRKSKEND